MGFLKGLFGGGKKEDPAKQAQMNKEREILEKEKTKESLTQNIEKTNQKIDKLSQEIVQLDSVS